MKILMIFVDMLRPNLLNVYDEQNPENAIDKRIKKWGGTLYTNCFTPAPDTPRSNGCLWSSRYPRDNGCDNRLKYPQTYLKEENQDFLALLKEQGYTFNFFMRPSVVTLSELPCSVKSEENYSGEKTLEEYIKTLNIEENSVTYISLEDFHTVITDCYAQEKYLRLGYEKIDYALEMIEKYIGIETFDLSIVFSDHGFKERKEKFGNDYYKQMNRDRTQIFMMIRQKNETIISHNHKLCSIMDIYPTVCNFTNTAMPYAIEGIDLFTEREYEKLLIEDHKTFSASMGQTIEYWAIRSKKGLAAVDAKKNWIALYDINDTEKEVFEQFLSEKASFFDENIKMMETHALYHKYYSYVPCYLDGSKRVKNTPIKAWVKAIILKVLKL